ncbi:uncharacterized protein V6R79_015687 [Siganus canaliculatus]
MPPKSKGKKARKAKSSAVVDALSTEEMSKDQMEEHIVRLREELDRVREEKGYFQLERDKIHSLWEISQRDQEEMKAKLRNQQREKDEAEERHRVEITVYKQKLKNVMSEHHNMTTEMKMDNMGAASLAQNQHRESELELRREIHGLQADLREKKLNGDNCVKELKLEHQVELMELANSYERRMREIEVRYQETMKLFVEEEGKKHTAQLDNLRDRMKSHTAKLGEDHAQELRVVRDHHNELYSKNIELKKNMEDMTKQLEQTSKDLSSAQQENRRLSRSLQEAQQQLPELKKQMDEYKTAKAEMMKGRARQKVLDKELRDQKVENELLLQACEKVQQERDELLRKQTEITLDIQQKCGLKELLLKKKLTALTETLEKTDAQLCAVLSVSNVDQTTADGAAKRLQELFESKQTTTAALESDLKQESDWSVSHVLSHN